MFTHPYQPAETSREPKVYENPLLVSGQGNAVERQMCIYPRAAPVSYMSRRTLHWPLPTPEGVYLHARRWTRGRRAYYPAFHHALACSCVHWNTQFSSELIAPPRILSVLQSAIQAVYSTNLWFRDLCVASPALWSNIVSLKPEGSISSNTVTITPGPLVAQLALSRERGLRIVFELPLSHGSTAGLIWELLLGARARWDVIFVKNSYRCGEPEWCLRGIVDVGLLAPCIGLRVASFTTTNALQTCPNFHSSYLDIPLTNLESLETWIPIRISVVPSTAVSAPHLTSIELKDQPFAIWDAILRNSVVLEILVWRTNQVAPPTADIIHLPTLRRLILHNMEYFPAIDAQNLRELSVLDRNHEFNYDCFRGFVGGDSAPTLRSLDLLETPTSDADLHAVFSHCPNLITFKVGGRSSEKRTELLRTLVKSVIKGYLRPSPHGMVEFTLSCAPSHTFAGDNAAADQYTHLLSLGFLVSSGTIRFHPRVWCIKFPGCSGSFHYDNETHVKRLREENDLQQMVTAVDWDRHNNTPRPRRFTLVIVFSDDKMALRWRHRSVKVNRSWSGKGEDFLPS
ncbi:hypothetical protein B0H16DRAFT_1712839 [Mycena metata]|uniref:F-box domain-containing protein n=1 Tax=Mycena metata TaxID=1033252 RepID=A0AAD7K1X1_9AGAR|nr:hypothetical protein B0H16DRAFT_1712839 [Mycena metata]